MTGRLRALVLALFLTVAAGVARLLLTPKLGAGASEHAAAVQLLDRRDTVGAAERLRKAIALEPFNGDYYAELGELHLGQSRFDLAADELQMAAFLAPNRPHVRCRQAQALLEDRRRDDALAAVELELKRDPRCPVAQLVRAEQHLRDDNLKGALADFEAVRKSVPNMQLPYQRLGYILFSTNRPAEALAVLQEGLKRTGSTPGLHFQLAESYARSASDAAAGAEAERHYRLAIPGNPEAVKGYAALGQLLQRRGDLPGARREYEAALKLNPTFNDAVYGLSQVAAQQGKREEANSLLKRFQDQDRLGREMTEFQAQVAANPTQQSRLELARRALSLGAFKAAAVAIDGAVAADPSNREARLLRSRLYAAIGRLDRAERERMIADRLPVQP